MITNRRLFSYLGFAALAASFVMWYDTKQTPVERLENEVQTAGRNLILFRSTKGWMWRDLWLRTASKYRHDPEGYYLNVIAHARSNLLILGILEKRAFEFHGPTNSYVAFNSASHETFDRDGFLWSYEFLTSNAIVVTAFPEQMSRWEKLVRRFDASPNN